MSQLAKIETISAAVVYQAGNAQTLISDLEKEVRSFVPDISSLKGRKDIASLAHKVSKSKTLLDSLGKELVAGWKDKAKLVDADRRFIRDSCDSLRDEVRQPLTDWEEAEKAKMEAEKQAVALLADHIEALAENDLVDRMREVERKEAEQLAKEQQRIADEEAKAEADRLEKAELARIEQVKQAEIDQLEREKQIAIDAAENARIELADKLKADQERINQELIDAKAAAQLEVIKAEQAAEQAEIDKAKAIKDAEVKARREAEEDEAARLEKLEDERIIAEKKAANKRHQGNINRSILKQLVALGIEESTGKTLIGSIAKREVKFLQIYY